MRRDRTRRHWTSAASRRLLKLAGDVPDISSAIEIVAGKYLDGTVFPPTDLEALGQRLNIIRFDCETLPISGELRREPEGFVVAYSSFLSPARRRFTIAHELAHAIFESSGRNCPRVGRELERLCDMLATEILMPRRVFVASCGTTGELTWHKIDNLARLFRTSLSATSLRCAELLGATVFEVDDSTITWAYGSIRKGPVAKLDEKIRFAIEKTERREPVNEQIFASGDIGRFCQWRVEGRTIGQEGRVLMLMLPNGR